MRKSAGILFLVILSSACSLFRAKVAPYPTGIVFPMIKDGELSYKGEIISRIQSEDHFLYFSTRKGKVYCVDGQNRRVLWQFDAPVSLESPAYLEEDHVYVYDIKGTLFCLDKSGKLLWRKKTEERITSDVVEDRGRTFFGTEKGELFCIDPENGKEIWKFQAGGAVRSNLVIWREMVLFGCEDHSFYFIGPKGNLSGTYDIGSGIGKTLTVDKDFLYFASEDSRLQCLNLAKRKIAWRIRSGENSFVPPAVDKKRVFFLCWNSVLYCLNKKNGTILWWGGVPFRSYYQVEIIQDKVVVSSLSPELVCFDIKNGEKKGTYEASHEIVSNPLWMKPFLLINVYDWENETGEMVILKKEVKAVLSPSKKSPQKRNEEIVFSARETGFYLPDYEFFLTRLAKYRLFPGLILFLPEEEKQTVQKSSKESRWSWFPDQNGYYRVGVLVTDEKESAEADFFYSIQGEKETVSLTPSLASPQEPETEIVFKASAPGLIRPRYEFELSRLSGLIVLSDFIIPYPEETKVVQELSESDSWAWTPEKEGWFWVRVLAQDNEGKVETGIFFTIRKKEE
jgi:outer membrane protein assembly factor BamB